MITLNDVEICKIETNDDYSPTMADVTISYRPRENWPDRSKTILTISMEEARDLKIGVSTDIRITNIPIPDAS